MSGARRRGRRTGRPRSADRHSISSCGGMLPHRWVAPAAGTPACRTSRKLSVIRSVSRNAGGCYANGMCRNIRPLFNFDPPVTDDEVHAASLQFVRKISGFTRPSKANEEAFDRAVEEVAAAARRLVDSLVTTAPARDRDVEATKAKARAAERYGRA